MTLSPLFITLRGTRLADVILQPDSIAAGSAQDITIEHLGLAGDDTITAWSGPSDWPSYATGALEASETLTTHNYLSGGGGDDVMIAGHTLPGLSETQTANCLRADTLDGWKGNDTYVVSDLNVTIRDDWGTNTLILTEDFAANSGLTKVSTRTFANNTANDIQNITLLGTADMDINGDGQHNILRGNDGRNLISSFDGDDRSYGGGGDDTIWGNGNTWESGGDGDDVLRSEGGNGTLLGNAGNDTLMASEGNDVLNGGGGRDFMMGFLGDDVYQVNLATDRVDETIGGGGFDTVSSAKLSLVAADYAMIECLTLLGHADLNLIGGNAVVALQGNAGANGLQGGIADETLSGGAGDDRLGGDAGNDLLNGGAGFDRLYGGGGADVFVFDSAADAAAAPDIIMDFTSGEDHIDLTALGLAQALPGGFAASGIASVTWFGETVMAGDLGFADVTTVAGDTDADGIEDFRLYLFNTSGTVSLTESDFLLSLAS